MKEVLDGQSVPRECDLIFEGGVTSGVVYPRAVMVFGSRFRLRSIGGTSAGAIAAGVAAAAEYGVRRQTAGATEADPQDCALRKATFGKVGELPAELGAPSGNATRMLRLFQPSAPMSSLYRWCLAGLSADRVSGLGATFRLLCAAPCHFPGWAIGGATAGVLLRVLDAWLLGGPLHFTVRSMLLLLLGLALGAVAGALVGVGHALFRVLPRQNFGMCSGHEATPGRKWWGSGPSATGNAAGSGTAGTEALTPWLHGKIQSLAGAGEQPHPTPLTFGDLWHAGEDGTAPGGDRAIDLRVMTTCVSQGRPYTFPLPPDETNTLFFKESDMRRLFPADVVDHLLAKSRTRRAADARTGTTETEAQSGQDDFHPLPEMKDLPILVALRMSLSFPLLLEAVPLYAREAPVPTPSASPTGAMESASTPAANGPRADEAQPPSMRRLWFSDGGLCSNFPVHLFDGPLPTRPTFAINLGDDLMIRDCAPAAAYVRVPRTNGEGKEERVLAPRDDASPGLRWFLGALLESSRGWSDHTQLRTPGFRDRVALISLHRDEGGMNLRMTGDQIKRLAKRGEAAAARLIAHFFPEEAGYPHTTTWQNHVWVRHRTGMLLLEQRLEALLAAVEHHERLMTSIDRLHGNPPSFPWKSSPRAARSLAALEAVRTAAHELRALRTSAVDAGEPSWPDEAPWLLHPKNAPAPRPRPVLQVRPEV